MDWQMDRYGKMDFQEVCLSIQMYVLLPPKVLKPPVPIEQYWKLEKKNNEIWKNVKYPLCNKDNLPEIQKKYEILIEW